MDDPDIASLVEAMDHLDPTTVQEAMELPVTASLGPMGPLLRKLHHIGLKDEIRPLKVLCISLKNMSEDEDASLSNRWWMKLVRELLYDAEDHLDEVSVAEDDEVTEDFSELLARVEDAIKRLKRLQSSHLDLGETSCSRLTSKMSLELTVPLGVSMGTGRCSTVGAMPMEPPKKLVGLLALDDHDKALKVIPIHGCAGVGKTTLARTLYHKHAGKYQRRAFVSVSRNPDMRGFLTSILSQLKAPRPRGFSDVPNLINSISKHLEGKRYFIVIDDLWTASVWNIISHAFPSGDYCSRIITTTHIDDVALACCSYDSDYIYKMEPLNDHDSGNLFFGSVFGSENGCPTYIKEVSHEIISKCGGLPLAIVNIARLLESEPNIIREKWMHIQDSLSSTSDGMKDVVNLMYNSLPPRLRTCLLYLSMYPQGSVIMKKELVNLWVAEGFLDAVEGIDTEEIARCYFDELVSRRMVQAVDTNNNGEVLSCTVHQLVLDFIRYKSLKENFIITVDYFQSTLALPDKVRRLSVQFGGVKSAYIPESIITSQVRSFIFWGFFKSVPSITEYGLLRILILHIWADQDNTSFDLTMIKQLFRLNYLKIECNITVELPGEIRRLRHLETLDVQARDAAVPLDIFHLRRMLHLSLPSDSDLPNGIGRMTSLRTLGHFDLSNNPADNLKDLGDLTNLRDLHLTCAKLDTYNLEYNMNWLPLVLGKLSSLKCLTLAPAVCSHVNSLNDAGASSMGIGFDVFSIYPPLGLERIELSRHSCIFSSLPEWIGDLINLRSIKIAIRGLSINDIDVLKVLPSLTALTLYIQTAPAQRIFFDKEGFQVLTYFKFMCAAPCLSFELGAMPKVRKVNLGFNANKMRSHTFGKVGFRHLAGLIDVCVKFGVQEGEEFDIKAAESSLAAAISNHTNNLIIRVQCVDVIFYGKEDKSTTKKVKEEKRQEIQEYETNITGPSGEHVNKLSVDSRYAIPDHVSTPESELVTGAMGSLLPKLLDLARDNYSLQTGVKRSIESLYKELEAMQAALYEVAKLKENQRDKVLDIWTTDVRDLSYDAEDIIDSLLSRIEGSLPGCIVEPNPRVTELFRTGKAHHEIAEAINGIMKRVLLVAARRKRYKVDDRIVANQGTTSFDPRLLALFKDPKELVGIKGSTAEVFRKLRNVGDDELKIVSIVGSGGLGKTTLAKSVYDRIQVQFDCRAFVSVSRNPDRKKVLRHILLEIDKKKYKNFSEATFNERQLINEVRKQLVNKRYFIVIDDIWDVKSWELIKCALIDSKCGSRVVTTTRKFDVAERAGDVYKLKALSRLDSEALFNKIIFYGKEEVPIFLPEVHEKLLQLCDGVPLALITIASLLANKHTNDWSKVYDQIGFGSQIEVNVDVHSTRKILMFSYYDLPYHLRACLLHLHTFPEDYVIKKETLIWKWAAEGFIVEKGQTGLFELGEIYFNELINRNLIIPVADDSLGGIIIGCRVHNMVLDMIGFISTEENFVMVPEGNKQKTHSESKARRVAVQRRALDEGNFLEESSGKMRSLNATMCQFRTTPSLSRFTLLRVLAIEECTFTETGAYHLQHIGMLIHLRYLGLYNTPIEKLPDEIGNIILLQTLDLRGTKVKSLPRRVGRLRQLKCLRTDETTTVPDWIGNLTSLEELRLYDVSKSENFMGELGKLTELRELHIWIEEFDENSSKSFVLSMGYLKKIQVLALMSSMAGEEANWEGYVPPPQLRELRLTIAFSRLPAWINVSLVPILAHLCVHVKAVGEQDLDILGALPELISLVVLMPSNLFPSIKGGGAFPKLRCFDTSAPFRFLSEAMPKLESLRFRVSVEALKRAKFHFDFATLSNLPLLQKVYVEICCRGARANRSMEAEAAVKCAVDTHPNSPILSIKKTDK